MVTLSSRISGYLHSFGRKVFGKILSAPGLEVCTMCVIQTALEVEVPGGFEGTKFGVQRQYHHEACDPIHPVVGFSLLGVAERGINDVRRYNVNIRKRIQPLIMKRFGKFIFMTPLLSVTSCDHNVSKAGSNSTQEGVELATTPEAFEAKTVQYRLQQK